MTEREKGSKVVLAMVALNDHKSPDQTDVSAFLKQKYPHTPEVKVVGQKEQTIVFRAAKAAGWMALMPGPIPWSDLKGPCAAAWYWREATDAMKQHVAHMIVALLGGTQDIVSRHLLLTKLVAAVSATTNCAGIYWGNGQVVNSPKEFIKRSAGIGPDKLPLSLWIDFRLQRTSKDAVRLFTTGLSAFNHMKMEAPPSKVEPMELFNLAYGLATYVLTSGKAVKDSDTFGRSETERIGVTYTPSVLDQGRTVMRLEL